MSQRRRYVLVVPYRVGERPLRLLIDVEAADALEAVACAWRSAEAMRPLLGGRLDDGGPFLLIAPIARAA